MVNGSGYVPGLLESLKWRRDVRFLYIEEGSATRARHAGRDILDTEFFGILDDDDAYLPGAVKTRLSPLLEDASINAVITNAYQYDIKRDSKSRWILQCLCRLIHGRKTNLTIKGTTFPLTRSRYLFRDTLFAGTAYYPKHF
jgi:glycosyltransferase involved in cell wall biosynthesis